MIARLKALLQRAKATRPWRAWTRYGDAHGSVLAGGVGYFAFFSIFPAVALAFAVFGFVLRDHPALLDSVTSALRDQLPGMVKDPGNPSSGGIISVQAPGARALTITGVVSFVGLVIAGTGWLDAMRTGIRAVFGVENATGNPVMVKLRDLGVMVTLGLCIAVSGVFTSAASGAAGRVAHLLGIGGATWLVQAVVLVVSAAADTGLMIVLLRVLSGVAVPWRALLQGAVIGGVGLTLMKAFAGQVIGHATSNPLLASLGIVVGLLVWLNLMSRLTLLSAAWAANDLDDGAERASAAAGGRHTGPGAPVTAGVRRSAATGFALRPQVGPRAQPTTPTFGTRSADRTTLAAGAVIGAGGAVVVSALGHGLRALTRLGRRPQQR